MSCYDYFKDDENATIVIKSIGGAVQDPVTYVITYPAPVIAYSGAGIFFELGASEQIARQQIQKAATGQVILDPELVTNPITEVMKVFVTTADATDKPYRMVTVVNPLNKDEALIIDLVED